MIKFKTAINSTLKDEFNITDPKVIKFIINVFYSGKNHRYYDGYKSYSYKQINRVFGKGEFLMINEMLGLFDVLPYSFGEKYTRGIKPSERLVRAFNDTIDTWLPEIDELEHEQFSKSGGIASRSIRNNTSKFKGNILQGVRVNTEALKALASIAPTTETDARIKAQAALMLSSALEDDFPVGWIPQRYTEHKTGRLYSDGISLQNCCKEVRFAALDGLYSYDIDNCHYSILEQLTETPTPTVSYYLNNKKAMRANLSTELGLSIDKVKQILIALIYGAGLGTYHKDKAISRVCGNKETYQTLINNSTVNKLHKEVLAAGRELIGKSLVKKGKHAGKPINAMGLVSHDKAQNKQLSHLLQGYEVKALEAITGITKLDTAALIHDGWVTYNKHNKAVFENAILEATGLKLNVDYSPIKCRIFTATKMATAQTNKGFGASHKKELGQLIERATSLKFPLSLISTSLSLNVKLNTSLSRRVNILPTSQYTPLYDLSQYLTF